MSVSSLAFAQDPSQTKNEQLVLYFQSENCEPCRQLEPFLLRYAANGWDIRKVEATRQLDLSRQYGIENLPTLVVLSQGREVDRIVGLVSEQQLHQRLQRVKARDQGHLAESPRPIASGRETAGDSVRAQAERVVSPPAQGPASASPIVRGQSPQAHSEGYPLLASRGNQSGVPVEFASQSPPDRSRAVSPPTRSKSQESLQALIEKATDATVRIKVEESNTTAYGTGTIVAAHQGEALVLTCGHLFRDMMPGSQLKVDLFAGTPRQTTVVAQLIDFKADKEDIGLLSFRMPVPVEPVAIMPRSEAVEVGQSVFSIGCDHGNDPTRRDTRITHVNRYLGPSNVEIEGAPAVGRSGGGLFDGQGRLIGVCNAACQQDNEGIYASAEVIYEQLARLDLTHLFEGNHSIASGSPPMSAQDNLVAQQSSGVQASSSTASDALTWPDEVIPSKSPPVASLTNSGASGPVDANKVQLICVLRDSKGMDRVVTIDQPSSDLLQAIEQQGGHRVANR